jgi:hypothetical protein
MTVPLGRCRACHQLVRWAITAAHGFQIVATSSPATSVISTVPAGDGSGSSGIGLPDQAPKHGTAAARVESVSMPLSGSASAPGPPAAPPPLRLCALESCAKVLPPPVRNSGRPRRYCNDKCSWRAHILRHAPAPAAPQIGKRPAPLVDGEDPTDRAIRMHKELHPVAESGSGMRGRAMKARTS